MPHDFPLAEVELERAPSNRMHLLPLAGRHSPDCTDCIAQIPKKLEALNHESGSLSVLLCTSNLKPKQDLVGSLKKDAHRQEGSRSRRTPCVLFFASVQGAHRLVPHVGGARLHCNWAAS